MFNFYSKISFLNALIILLLIASLSGCKDLITNNVKTTENKMYVYPNKGNTFYLVDYKTYEVVREIKLNVPHNTYLFGMILSTNRDHLIFSAHDTTTHREGFLTYDITNDKMDNIYITDLINIGPERFISGQNRFLQGLVYVYYPDLGIYLLDVFERKVVKLISSENGFNIDKDLFHSPDGKWDVIRKSFGAQAYSEIEVYTANTDFTDLQFVLNQNNKDSIDVYYSGIAFSLDNRLFISYQPSGGKYNTAGYIGVYDLNTRQLTRTSLKFPWSLNGYYIAYNSSRNELYDVGNKGIFYIIDTDTYTIKKTINLSVQGQESPIVLSPDKNTAFVAFSDNDKLFVIDLSSGQIIKTISLNHPYKILIP